MKRHRHHNARIPGTARAIAAARGAIMFCTVLSAAALLGSCSSPLDPEVPRVDTRIFNAVKFRMLEINARIIRPDDTAMIPEWRYTAAQRTCSVDTAGPSPSFGMDCTLDGVPDTAAAWLKGLRLHVESAPAASSMVFGRDSIARGSLTATVVIDGTEQVVNANYTASASLQYTDPAHHEVRGTIFIGADRSPAFSLVIAVNFRANRD